MVVVVVVVVVVVGFVVFVVLLVEVDEDCFLDLLEGIEYLYFLEKLFFVNDFGVLWFLKCVFLFSLLYYCSK